MPKSGSRVNAIIFIILYTKTIDIAAKNKEILLKQGEKAMMSSREVIRILEKDGWQHVKTTGDHFQFKHPEKPGKVTVAHPKKNLGIKDIISIERQSGLKIRRRG